MRILVVRNIMFIICAYIHCNLGFVITGRPESWDEGISGPVSCEAIQCEGVGIYRYIPRFVSRWGSHDAGHLNSWPTTCRHVTFICIPISVSPPCSLSLKGAVEGGGGEEGV